MVGNQKQRHPRIRKRVSVRFGTTSDVRSTGFTQNASFRGLAVSATSVHPAGTFLHFELKLNGDKFCRATGMVVWSVRGMLALQMPGTMGIQIQSADESFFQLLAENTQDDSATPRVQAQGAASAGARTVRPVPSRPTTSVEPRVGGATISGMPSNPKPPRVSAPPPPPRLGFRFPRLTERISVSFGALGSATPRTAAVRISAPAPLSEAGFTTNVSRSGFALTCERALTPGEEVRFVMKLPDQKTCEGRGSVIWTKLERVNGAEKPQMGIHIARIDQTYRDYLQWLGRRVGIAV